MSTDLRRRLEEERDRLTSELALLAEDERTRPVDEKGYDNHLADDATDTYEVEKDIAVEQHLERLLDDVEHALRRMDQGTYGICENCGQPIDPARLEALPHTRYCLACSKRLSGRHANVQP